MSTKNLIYAIIEGDADQIQSSFKEEMSSRIVDRIDDIKQYVAQNMFKSDVNEEVLTEGRAKSRRPKDDYHHHDGQFAVHRAAAMEARLQANNHTDTGKMNRALHDLANAHDKLADAHARARDRAFASLSPKMQKQTRALEYEGLHDETNYESNGQVLTEGRPKGSKNKPKTSTPSIKSAKPVPGSSSKRGRGRPSKEDSTSRGHIIMQLRGAADLNPDSEGNYTVAFPSGKKAKIKKEHAEKIIKIYNNLEKPRDKRVMVAAMRSPTHLQNVISKLSEDIEYDILQLCENFILDVYMINEEYLDESSKDSIMDELNNPDYCEAAG
jgi:hypothetical protein